MLVPTLTNLSFYSNPDAQRERYGALETAFRHRFHTGPAFVARAPGRVNLIGEHIDYCHFSVLPMAIEADVIAAVHAAPGESITIANTNPKFATAEIPVPRHESDILVDKVKPLWADYFKCGMLVARKYLVEKHLLQEGQALKAFNAVFDGSVPAGGGLSSSAAFCIAATLAVLKVNGEGAITKSDLTRITVVCEHYVGLSNGGMDQSASINGEDGKVMLILFKPALHAEPFQMPKLQPELSFLISNSLVTANKTETAPSNYNLRVVEVAVAADLVAREFALDCAQDSNIQTATLRGAFDAYCTQKLGLSPWDGADIAIGIERLQDMLKVVETLFSDAEKDGMLTEHTAQRLGLSGAEFSARYLSHFPVKYDRLNIYRRTKHVYGDSLRVLQTLELMRSFNGDAQGFLQGLGRLMDESQASTRDLNQASTAECDQLCTLGRQNGSYGSRVTGAGFGGCVVHLTTVDRLDALRSTLEELYYRKRWPAISDSELADAIVVSKPAMGACVLELE